MTQERARADYIVVDDCTNAGMRNELAMLLKGGTLLESKCFSSVSSTSNHLGSGTRLAFKSPLSQPKWIYLSEDFKEVCKGIARVIQDDAIRLQPAPRRWKIVSYDDLEVDISVSTPVT